jgi:hypothetical protein
MTYVAQEPDASTQFRLSRPQWLCCCCLAFFVLPLISCDRDRGLKLFGYDRATLLKKYTPPVDSQVVYGRDGSLSSITVEYEFEPLAVTINGVSEISGNWLIAQVVIQTKGGVKTIAGLHVMPSSKSFEEINEFTLANKGLSQYAGLCIAIGVAAFSLYAFVLCARTRLGKKKWLWLVLILIGVFRLTVNWTTGEWSVTPLIIQVPPVICLSTLYGPWMVQIAVPLGAIAFLLWREKIKSGIASSLSQSPVLGQ